MDEIHCHDQDGWAQRFGVPRKWRAPDAAVRTDGGEGTPFRTCDYCGCIHPDDLIAAFEAGATMHGSDWKYGWPHKFYVEGIPNPNIGVMVRTVSGGNYNTEEEAKAAGAGYAREGNELRTEPKEKGKWGFQIFSPARDKTHAKWYNVHLKDLDDEKFKKLSDLLLKHTDILFGRDEKGLKYSSPRPGHQR